MQRTRSTKIWTKPVVKKLGRLLEVATKANTLQDGSSSNFTFGS